ncbi:MAG TPA: class I tRNA ligase family protein, partial [Solirubrobacteraceae bacterium]|nr:class I tRNA ligase family protein [Solirubrobacteraceae bacterium]
VRFSEEKVLQGQQLTNKLWNAARLILLGIEPGARPGPVASSAVEDRWIISRLARAKAEVRGRIERYDFSHAALALYDFVYGELCDWYLELVKPRLRDHDSDAELTLLHVLVETVSLAHPIIPFVTEEIYAHIPGVEGLLAAGIESPPETIDEEAEAALERTIAAVQAIRGWRAVSEVKAGAIIPARLAAGGYEDTAGQVERLARLAFSPDGGDPVASVAVPGGAIEILPTDELDPGAAEKKRAAERAKLEAEIARAEAKLANQGFVAKAPEHVVAAEREKLARLRAELEAL